MSKTLITVTTVWALMVGGVGLATEADAGSGFAKGHKTQATTHPAPATNLRSRNPQTQSEPQDDFIIRHSEDSAAGHPVP